MLLLCDENKVNVVFDPDTAAVAVDRYVTLAKEDILSSSQTLSLQCSAL